MENESSLPDTFEAPAGVIWTVQKGEYASTNVKTTYIRVDRSVYGWRYICVALNVFEDLLTAKTMEAAALEAFDLCHKKASDLCAAFAEARTQTPLPAALTEPPDDDPESHACSGCQTPCGCSNGVCMGCGDCQDRGDWGYRPKR